MLASRLLTKSHKINYRKTNFLKLLIFFKKTLDFNTAEYVPFSIKLQKIFHVHCILLIGYCQICSFSEVYGIPRFFLGVILLNSTPIFSKLASSNCSDVSET